MRVVAVGLAALATLEMGVVAAVGGGTWAELGIRRVVSAIRAVMLLLRERMRAWACFDATKRYLLHQILVVCLHQMPQRLARR